MANTPDFQDVYRDYHPKVMRFLTRLVGETEAEDLSQETFVKIDRGLKDFRGDSSLSTWIYRIARNVALDRHRSAAARREDSMVAMPEEGLDGDGEDVWTGEKARSLEDVTLRREMNT